MRIAGEPVGGGRVIEVRNPWDGSLVGTVPRATVADVRRAFAAARRFRPSLTRHERATILRRTADALAARREEISDLITAESGLCKKDTLHEVDRARDVVTFAAQAAVVDDGRIFSGDIAPHGRARRIYTQRDPLRGVIAAITPFNHPLNQVAHKVAPSIATSNRMVLKPSEKTPLTALQLADLLYEAGLPPAMFSVVTGDPAEIGDELITNPDVELITVMPDADPGAAAALAAAGSYRNSGQRCTAVKRILVHEAIADRFVDRLVDCTAAVRYGDPMDRTVDMGTLIDEAAARRVEGRVSDALAAGAPLRPRAAGRPLRRDGAGPRAARLRVRARRDVRAGVAGNALPRHRRGDPPGQRDGVRPVVRRLHLAPRLDRALRQRARGRYRQRVGGPGLPAGAHPVRRHQGLSGLGHKESVLEAMKSFTHVKTYSLPWA